MLTMLMYHRILPRPHPNACTIAMFERQLDYLQRRFRVLSPDEVLAYVNGDLPETRPCVALSFDDGWLDNLLYATPVLRGRGLRAMLAVSGEYLHDGPVRDHESEDALYVANKEGQRRAAGGDYRSYLNREELKAMHESGAWSLEAHGTRHLRGRDDASVLALPQAGETREDFQRRLRADISGCCEAIAAIAGRAPQAFFWPWGHYSTPGAGVAREMGLIQFTTAKGFIRPRDGRPALPRVAVPQDWGKFRKNCLVYHSPLLTALHDLFHTAKVCFDDRLGAAGE